MKLYQWFCQMVADYHFDKALQAGLDTHEGHVALHKYFDWLDIKFFKKPTR